MRITTLAALGAAACTAACGGGSSSDGPMTPSVKANATYQGVFATGVERGTVSLVSGSPASGSLTVGNGSAVALSGSFNAATSAFALSGGGFSVNATAVTNGTLSGTVTGTSITGTGTMAAAEAAASVTTIHYCGVYSGDDAGMVEVITAGSSAAAVVSGMGGGFTMTGTASGSSISVTVTGAEPGTGKTNTVTANLTIAGSIISGTGSSTLYPTQKVNITASSAACANTAPTGPFDSYVGYAYNNGYTGLLSVAPGSPASGSIAWNGGASTALSGTYNAATGAFALTGGGLTLTATAAGASLTGTVGGPLTPVTTASVVAMGSSATTRVTRSCGTVSGGMSGKMILLQGGSTLSGIFLPANANSWMNLSGTSGGTWAYLTSAAGAYMYFAGTGNASGLSGTWANVNNTAGTWSVSGC